eukprot:364998-Chlamydomonas_euryale.AAC.7
MSPRSPTAVSRAAAESVVRRGSMDNPLPRQQNTACAAVTAAQGTALPKSSLACGKEQRLLCRKAVKKLLLSRGGVT